MDVESPRILRHDASFVIEELPQTSQYYSNNHFRKALFLYGYKL